MLVDISDPPSLFPELKSLKQPKGERIFGHQTISEYSLVASRTPAHWTGTGFKSGALTTELKVYSLGNIGKSRVSIQYISLNKAFYSDLNS